MTKIDSIAAVRQSIEDLIAAGTNFDIDALDRIYHDTLHIVMLAPDGQV